MVETNCPGRALWLGRFQLFRLLSFHLRFCGAAFPSQRDGQLPVRLGEGRVIGQGFLVPGDRIADLPLFSNMLPVFEANVAL